MLASGRLALGVEIGDELAAEVVEEGGWGEEMGWIVYGEGAERPVRVAEAGECLADGIGRALGVLGGREGRVKS